MKQSNNDKVGAGPPDKDPPPSKLDDAFRVPLFTCLQFHDAAPVEFRLGEAEIDPDDMIFQAAVSDSAGVNFNIRCLDGTGPSLSPARGIASATCHLDWAEVEQLKEFLGYIIDLGLESY